MSGRPMGTKAMSTALDRIYKHASALFHGDPLPFHHIDSNTRSVSVVSAKRYPVSGEMLPRILTVTIKSARLMDARAAYEGRNCLVSTYDLTYAVWCSSLHGEKDVEAVVAFCCAKITEMTRG